LSSIVMVDLNKNEGWLEVFLLPSFLVTTYFNVLYTNCLNTYLLDYFFWTSHMIIKNVKNSKIYLSFSILIWIMYINVISY
jgi:hypothetical protein